MRFIYSTDLHGFEWKYDFILNYALKENLKLVLNGGDLLPKGNDIHSEQRIFIEKYLFGHFDEYEKNKINYYFILGNDDLRIFDEIINSFICDKNFVKNLAEEKQFLSGFQFSGFELVKDAPFLLKDRFRRDLANDVSEPETLKGWFSTQNGFQTIDWMKEYYTLPSLEEELNKLEMNANNDNEIVLIHQPPYGLSLATLYSKKDVGSKAVAKFIENKKPGITFHGHIHESFKAAGIWRSVIGDTICIQPGQEDDLIFVEGDLEKKTFERKVISYKSNFYLNGRFKTT